jgi:hypothetical protein
MIRIEVDFNAMNKAGTHIWINTRYYPDLLDFIQPGLRLLLYTEGDIEVEANIEVETDKNGVDWWYGHADWSTLKYI